MSLRILIPLLLTFLPGTVLGQSGEPSQFALQQPGVLIITAARDSLAGFEWRTGPGSGRISLVWEGGALSVPDTLAMEAYPNLHLGIPVLKGFSGSLEEGPLIFEDGVYPIRENLVLSDGVVQLVVSSGELEIHGPRFRYTRSDALANKSKANFLLIAGLLVLIAVLLRRARKILRKRA